MKFYSELPAGNGDPSTRRGKLQRFAVALRANPGQWAAYPDPVPKSLYNVAVSINSGRTASLRHGFEAAVRKKVLYVRYVGEVSSE